MLAKTCRFGKVLRTMTHLDAQPKPLDTRGQLEQFLAEIGALAIQLKWRSPAAVGETLPVSARAALQLLQRSGPMTVPALARARGTSRQNIQIIVNRLKKAGWIGMSVNPAHKKSELVFVTESGKSALDVGAAHEAQLFERLLSCASEPELASACELVQRFRRALAGQGTLKRKPSAPAPKAARPVTPPPEEELPVSLL